MRSDQVQSVIPIHTLNVFIYSITTNNYHFFRESWYTIKYSFQVVKKTDSHSYRNTNQTQHFKHEMINQIVMKQQKQISSTVMIIIIL
jgi:hypothetical protein